MIMFLIGLVAGANFMGFLLILLAIGSDDRTPKPMASQDGPSTYQAG